MKCMKCDGTGQVKEGAKFTGSSAQCKRCGWTAIGKLVVYKLASRGGYCSDCKSD